MKTFVVSVPVFNSKMAVVAYKLIFQKGDRLLGLSSDPHAFNDAMYNPGMEMFNSIGYEPFTGNKPIFVDFNQFHILMSAPVRSTIPPELLCCVLSKGTPADETIYRKCCALRELGYSIALNDIAYTKDNVLFNCANFLLLDYNTKNAIDKALTLKKMFPEVKIVITNIKKRETFEKIKAIPDCLFEGSFYNSPLTEGPQKLAPIKSNVLQLLKIVGDPDFDLDKVSKIIKTDPAFTISLFKFINSPIVGVKRKIESINNAVAFLGQKETRRWITVTVSTLLGEDRPNELTKLSLVRAKFAENLAPLFELGIHAPNLFITGLFSLLDIMLDKPMHEAINDIYLSENIKRALLDKSGAYFDVLDFIYSYEHADWEDVACKIIKSEINVDDLNKAFTDALIWYKVLLDAI